MTTSDLIARLRDRSLIFGLNSANRTLFTQAADRLSELERERDEAVAKFDLQVRGHAKTARMLSAAERSLEEAKGVIETVLSADREALANHRPKWGIADCIDNDGIPYQSQHLGDALNRARTFLFNHPDNPASGGEG